MFYTSFFYPIPAVAVVGARVTRGPLRTASNGYVPSLVRANRPAARALTLPKEGL